MRNDDKAIALFQKACDGGVEDACIDLADAYVEGRGVSKDESKGVKMIEQLCEERSAAACFNLAMKYRTGRGVAQNIVKAAMIFEDVCPKVEEACEAATELREQLRREP